MKEFVDEREQLLYQVTDAQQRADKYMAELKQSREAQAKLDSQLRETSRLLADHNPDIVREQKDLILELRQKVGVLERELNLIVKSTNEEMARLKVDNSKLAAKTADQHASSLVDQDGLARVRQLLATSKTELDEASRQIYQLKQELKT